MSDLLDELKAAATVAEGFIPFTGTITSVSDTTGKVLSLIAPPIVQAEVDKPKNEQHDRIAQYEKIIDIANEAVRAVQLSAFSNQLLLDAALPVGLLSGRTITVPVEHFTAYIDGVGQLIEEREQAAAQVTKAVTK